MFNNSKYGNVLTVILIIAIIAIIGIVCIIGYRIYKSYSIEVGAGQAVTEFEQSVQQNQNNLANDIVGEEQNNIKQDISSGIEGTISQGASGSGTSSAQTTTKYKGFNVVGTIQIPTIDLKYPILDKVTKKSLETSVALLYTAQGLNKEGNTVIIGHNYRNRTMFSNLKKLTNGDYIYITDNNGQKIRYTVYKIYRASGTESDYITRNTNGKREISLSTCTDDSKARTIVLARES